MAISIETTQLAASVFVTNTSRYANSNVILWGDQRITTFDTYKRRQYVESESDKFAVIPPGEQYRPDLTSQRAYGTVDFWWRIMEANRIFDVFDYKAGRNIRIPGSLFI